MRRLGCVWLLVSACDDESASFECRFDDTDVGDVYEQRTLDCETYRLEGAQIRGAAGEACAQEATSLGADPPTCTCDWVTVCPGGAND